MARVTTEFMHTDLEHCLRCAGVKLPNRRRADDRGVRVVDCQGCYGEGFECLLVTDRDSSHGTKSPRTHIDTMLVEGGIFGSVADAHHVLVAFGSMGSASRRTLSQVALRPRPPPHRQGNASLLKLYRKLTNAVLLELQIEVRGSSNSRTRDVEERPKV